MKWLCWCFFVIYFLLASVTCSDASIFFDVNRYEEIPGTLALRAGNYLNDFTRFLSQGTHTDYLNRIKRSNDHFKTENVFDEHNHEIDNKGNNSSKSDDGKVIPNANTDEFIIKKDKKEENNELRQLLLGRMDPNMLTKEVHETNEIIKEIPFNNIDNARRQRVILLRKRPSGRSYMKQLIYVAGNNKIKPGDDFEQMHLPIEEANPQYGSEIYKIKMDQPNNLGADKMYTGLKGFQHNPIKYHNNLNYYDYPRLIHIISKTTGGKYVDPGAIFKHPTTTYPPPAVNEELDYETIIKILKQYRQDKQEPSELIKITLLKLLQDNNTKKNVKFDVPIKTTNFETYDEEMLSPDSPTYKNKSINNAILRLFEKINSARKAEKAANEVTTVSDSVLNSTDNENMVFNAVPVTSVSPYENTKGVEVIQVSENLYNKQTSDSLGIAALNILPVKSIKELNEINPRTPNPLNDIKFNNLYRDTSGQPSIVNIGIEEPKIFKEDPEIDANVSIKLPEDLKTTISKKLCMQAYNKLLEAWDLVVQTLGLNSEESKGNDEKRYTDIIETFKDITMQRDFNELPLQVILEKFMKAFSTKHPEDALKQAFRTNYYNLPLKYFNPETSNELHSDERNQNEYDDHFKSKLLEYYNLVNLGDGEDSSSQIADLHTSQELQNIMIREMSIALADQLAKLSNDPYKSPDEIVSRLIGLMTSRFNFPKPQNDCGLNKYLVLVEGFKQLIDDYYSNERCVNEASLSNANRKRD